ncbi:MAG: hypothetical protein QXS27_03925 [Candidatus Jordarchaeaceae archaeon]
MLETQNETGKITSRFERVTEEFLELLKRYRVALDEAVSLITNYKTEVFPVLEKAVNRILVTEELESFKNYGRISAVSETKNVGIPFAVCSTSYGEDDKLFDVMQKIYQEFEGMSKPFSYFFFSDPEGRLEVSENIARIVQLLFVDKVSNSNGKGGIIVNLKTLPILPSGGSKIFVNKNIRRDPHNIMGKLKGLLDESYEIIDDEKVFGGGSLTYCLNVIAESANIDVSILDLTITSDLVEADRIRKLIQAFSEIAEKEFT